jgi:hypothetical protein
MARGDMKDFGTSSFVLVMTGVYILIAWTLIVVVAAVVLPQGFDLKTPWSLVALAWFAPFLAVGGPLLWKRRRSNADTFQALRGATQPRNAPATPQEQESGVMEQPQLRELQMHGRG